MAQSVGSLGASYVNTQADAGPFEVEGDGFLIDYAGAMPAFGEWTVSAGGQLTYSDNDLGEDTSLSGSVHLTREFAGLRAGGFVAAADTGSDTLWTVGGQVQKDFAKASLTGVASYGSVDELDVWTVGGDAAYFIQPGLRVNANFAWNSLEFDGSDDDVLTYGVGAEYQIKESPISVFGGWDRASFDKADLDIDTFSIGLRFSFGGDLQTRDRSGADLSRKIGGVAGAVAFIDGFSTQVP